VAEMPSEKAGLLFLRAGRPGQPDPTMLDMCKTHAPQRRGHWRSSPDITAAMLAHLQKAQLRGARQRACRAATFAWALRDNARALYGLA
jgi:hypothetical protein